MYAPSVISSVVEESCDLVKFDCGLDEFKHIIYVCNFVYSFLNWGMLQTCTHIWCTVRPIPVLAISVGTSISRYLFSIGADTSSSFACLNSQHCCMHAYSFKPVVYLILRNTFTQHYRQQ